MEIWNHGHFEVSVALVRFVDIGFSKGLVVGSSLRHLQGRNPFIHRLLILNVVGYQQLRNIEGTGIKF